MSGNPSTPTHRRHNPYHDYCQPCIYHITLVCSDRGQVLGRIVGETVEQARCELSPLGIEVSECIRHIEVYGAKHGHSLQVIAKAVMPDHVHFILYVRERLTDCRLGDIIRGFKQGCNKALRAAIEAQVAAGGTSLGGCDVTRGRQGATRDCLGVMQGSGDVTQGTHDMGADMNGKQNNKQGPPPPRTPAQSVLPMAGEEMSPLHTVSHSSQSYPAAHCSPSMSEGVSRLNASHGYRLQPLPITSQRMLGSHALFEEDFDETILRRKGQLQTMIRYVHNNPLHRWQKQRHPDRLVPIRDIMIAGRMYDAIGNLTLLGMARHQVWVLSRWDETYRRNYQNECIVKARLFHTLVSPFISPHEAAVRDVALHEGHSIIVLADNGFSDYTQCPGGLYDYCVKGQVLVIVPSELPHISTKKSISRQECVMLN